MIDVNLTMQQWILLAVVMTAWLLIIVTTVFAVLRAANLPPPTLLVVVLSILTLVTLAAFVATRQQELATLAGTGFGALAGAVAAVWTRPVRADLPESEQPSEHFTHGV